MSHMVNLVRVLTAATGNSTPITLGAAYSQLFMTPAEAGAIDGRTYTWLYVDGNNWELVRGVYTASGTTAARTTILASRINGTLGTTRITLSGTAQVRIVDAAEDKGGLRGTRVVTGTTDVLMNSDQEYVVTYSNASAIAASLAQAGTAGAFLDSWAVYVKNKGVGTLTITPATSTINGAATLVLAANQGAFIWSDGTNYQAFIFRGDLGTAAVRADADFVRTDAAQSLTTAQQGLALKNIGAANLGPLLNGKIVPSVLGNYLTVAIKTLAGTDPSAADPVTTTFRDSSVSGGSYVPLAITAAASLVISAGSTMGALNATPFRLWLVGFNDAGTFRLGAIRCTAPGVIYPLSEWALKSSTAEGYVASAAAGGADAAGVIYTDAAVSSKAFRVLGFMDWNTGLTAAGTWDAAPSVVQQFEPGIPRPGEPLQSVQYTSTTTDSTTGTSWHVTNVAAPSITLTSPVNLVNITAAGPFGTTVGANEKSRAAILRGGAPIGAGTMSYFDAWDHHTGYNFITPLNLDVTEAPGSVGPLSYAVAIKSDGTASTVYFPLVLAAPDGGSIRVTEVMA